MSTHVVTLTDQNFESEVLQSAVPVVVDFWAAWCGPCRLLSPIVEDLAAEFAGKAKVAKLNVDEYPDLATQYQIQAIPTLLFFQGGNAVDESIGVATKRTLSAKLNVLLQQNLAGSAA